MTTRTPWLWLSVCGFIGGLLGYVAGGPGDFHDQTLITLEASTPVVTQLFYDTGKGFNESESSKQVVYQANVPVTLLYDRTGSMLKGLRFDPSRSPAKIKIQEIVLQYRKEKPFAVPLDSLTPVKDIKSMVFNGHLLNVETTEAAQDPILQLTNIGPAPQRSILSAWFPVAAGAAITLGIAFFTIWVYRNSL